MLFIPRKNSLDINELLINNKDIKIIPLTTTQPEIKEIKETETIQKEYVRPEAIKKVEYKSISPSVIKVKKIKKEKRKSRKRNDE